MLQLGKGDLGGDVARHGSDLLEAAGVGGIHNQHQTSARHGSYNIADVGLDLSHRVAIEGQMVRIQQALQRFLDRCSVGGLFQLGGNNDGVVAGDGIGDGRCSAGVVLQTIGCQLLGCISILCHSLRHHGVLDRLAQLFLGSSNGVNHGVDGGDIGRGGGVAIIVRHVHGQGAQGRAVHIQSVLHGGLGNSGVRSHIGNRHAECLLLRGHGGGNADAAHAFTGGVEGALVRIVDAGDRVGLQRLHAAVRPVGSGGKRRRVAHNTVAVHHGDGGVQLEAAGAVAGIRQIHQVTPSDVSLGDRLAVGILGIAHRRLDLAQVIIGSIVQQSHFQVTIGAHAGGDAGDLRGSGQGEPCVSGGDHHDRRDQQHAHCAHELLLGATEGHLFGLVHVLLSPS